MAQLSIGLGLKSYDIVDADSGALMGTIRINPADLGLVPRWKEAEAKIKDLASALPTGDDDATITAIGELDKQVKAQIDYAFGAPVSAVLFGGMSSLAMCDDGRMVLENVLESLAPIIKEAQETAVEAGQHRVAERTKKYQGTALGLAPGQK